MQAIGASPRRGRPPPQPRRRTCGVAEQNEENIATARAYLDGRGLFPERAALNQLGGRFLTDFYVMVAEWVDWATSIVEDWSQDVREAELNLDAQREAVRLAEGINAILQRTASEEGS